MRRLITPALALAAASLALTACGSDSDTDAESEVAIAAIGSQIAREMPADQARCTAEKLVAAVGVEKLVEATALTEDNIAQLNSQFDATVAGQIADATVACWDWRENTETWASAYPAADPKDWDAYVACAEKLDGKLRAHIVAHSTKGGSSKASRAFAAAQETCRKPLGSKVG
jgi:hypothetical protein